MSMATVQFTKEHKYRIIIVLLIVCIVLYFTVPRPDHLTLQEINKKGLSYTKGRFYLNGAPFRIFSGSIHYFRVVPEYWEDRLLKLRAAGLNTVMTYVPWNKHEEIKGTFNFEGILNLRQFLKKAHELGLYVILRPGPYICAEWEFGGLPSWLLKDPNMKVRSMYFGYSKAVDEYYKQLMHEIVDLQLQRGGPIIAFQLENEYGSYEKNDMYIHYLRRAMEKYGIIERMFLSDNEAGIHHSPQIPGVFLGANFNNINTGRQIFSRIRSLDLNAPPFAIELWSGWFVGWGARDSNNVIQTKDLLYMTQYLIDNDWNINFYMFHGGTNFEFMNGYNALDRIAVITSYDYFAPLTENGDITEKYKKIRSIIIKALSPSDAARVPAIPENIPSHAYGNFPVVTVLPWESLLEVIEKPITSEQPLMMEELPVNENSGQGYGFTLYRTEFKNAQRLYIKGTVYDRGLVLVNGAVLDPKNPSSSVVNSTSPNPIFDLKHATLSKKEQTLDIMVENMGRANYASFRSDTFNQQRKGLSGKVFVDEELLKSWKIYPLEFKKSFLTQASSSDKWQAIASEIKAGGSPGLYKVVFRVQTSKPRDTFIDMRMWCKGVVFVNGFNIGRYFSSAGPQKTLYLPGPLLRSGDNEVLIFELHKPGSSVELISRPIFDFPNDKKT